MNNRKLTNAEIDVLKQQKCTADDWQLISVSNNFKPESVIDVHFSGQIKLGFFERTFNCKGGVVLPSGIYHAKLHNCIVGNNVRINNIHNYIANYRIDDDTLIENVNAIVVDGLSAFGNGVRVPLMNEGNGKEIPIFDFLSSHLAYLFACNMHRLDFLKNMIKQIDVYAQSKTDDCGYIGRSVRICNCGTIMNVRIDDAAIIEGVSVLQNGSILSTSYAPVHVGYGVKCQDFIIMSGVEILDSTLISNCFVGQGCFFGKHYSASDSLFFSNCLGMHGEAAAVFAGPYTVSHHKSTLLIAGIFSFLNAGSGSNQSNHLYKLGPIHQGIAERGVKTTSDSYLLWPARIGAFSLVIGRHTKHSDTSDLPFSYLIEEASESFLLPAINLCSVGTIRDAQKWPQRDRRKRIPEAEQIDKINFNLLSPYTIQKMFRGIEILTKMQQDSGKEQPVYRYEKCKIRYSAMSRGIKYYQMAITKFLGNSLISRIHKYPFSTIDELRHNLSASSSIGSGEWIDASGLIVPKTEIDTLTSNIEAGKCSLKQIHEEFIKMHQNYYEYEWTWALEKLENRWNKNVSQITIADLKQTIEEWIEAVEFIDNQLYADALKEHNLSKMEETFDESTNNISPQSDFNQNPFVQSVVRHISEKNSLGNYTISLLQSIY